VLVDGGGALAEGSVLGGGVVLASVVLGGVVLVGAVPVSVGALVVVGAPSVVPLGTGAAPLASAVSSGQPALAATALSRYAATIASRFAASFRVQSSRACSCCGVRRERGTITFEVTCWTAAENGLAGLVAVLGAGALGVAVLVAPKLLGAAPESAAGATDGSATGVCVVLMVRPR